MKDLNGVDILPGDRVAWARRAGNQGILLGGVVTSLDGDRFGAVVIKSDSGREIQRHPHQVAVTFTLTGWPQSSEGRNA